MMNMRIIRDAREDEVMRQHEELEERIAKMKDMIQCCECISEGTFVERDEEEK